MWFEGPYDCLFHLEFFDCLPLSLYVFVAYDPFICNLWVLNIVCFPPTTYHCICVFLCTHLLRSTHFLEDHLLYWLSKLFVHFGNRCQWGRSLESLVYFGYVQRGLLLLRKHLHLARMHYCFVCVRLVMLISLYKLS